MELSLYFIYSWNYKAFISRMFRLDCWQRNGYPFSDVNIFAFLCYIPIQMILIKIMRSTDLDVMHLSQWEYGRAQRVFEIINILGLTHSKLYQTLLLWQLFSEVELKVIISWWVLTLTRMSSLSKPVIFKTASFNCKPFYFYLGYTLSNMLISRTFENFLTVGTVIPSSTFFLTVTALCYKALEELKHWRKKASLLFFKSLKICILRDSNEASICQLLRNFQECIRG